MTEATNNPDPEKTTPPTPAATSEAEEAETAALAEMVEQRRRELGVVQGPKPIAVGIRAALDRIAKEPDQPARKPIDPAEVERERQAQMLAQRQASEKHLLDTIGRRYADCELENFQLHGEPAEQAKQRDCLAKLGLLRENLHEHVRQGGAVILYGPPGTGKDHLLVAMLRIAIRELGCPVLWRNGQELFGSFRDNIDESVNESQFIRSLSESAILAISDPVPPKGSVSNFGTGQLYRVLDQRYRRRRSVWMTMNVATKEEAIETLSGPVFDRMLDNAFTYFCNWPSYRAKNKPQWLLDKGGNG